LLQKFSPEAILVSAGFDAVKGDPLGECRVSPEGFGWMTRCLYRLAAHFCEARIFLALEGGYNPDMIAQCTVECVRSLIAETSGLEGTLTMSSEAAELLPPAPSLPPSAPSTPAMTPSASTASPSSPTPLDLNAEATPVSTPRSKPEGSPPASPSHGAKKEKARGACNKTVRLVRKLTELHHLLPLELPLAPQQTDGAGASKNAKKTEKRRQRKHSLGDEDAGASSDSSGWAIACGGDPEEPLVFSPSSRPRNASDGSLLSPALRPRIASDGSLFSPAWRPTRQVSGNSVPELELPPVLPGGTALPGTSEAPTSPAKEKDCELPEAQAASAPAPTEKKKKKKNKK